MATCSRGSYRAYLQLRMLPALCSRRALARRSAAESAEYRRELARGRDRALRAVCAPVAHVQTADGSTPIHLHPSQCDAALACFAGASCGLYLPLPESEEGHFRAGAGPHLGMQTSTAFGLLPKALPCAGGMQPRPCSGLLYGSVAGGGGALKRHDGSARKGDKIKRDYCQRKSSPDVTQNREDMMAQKLK
jgi:hypothetical protein